MTYRKLDNTADYLPVRRRVEEIIQQAEFSSHTFSDNKHVSEEAIEIFNAIYYEVHTFHEKVQRWRNLVSPIL